jgi:hypothetical protein
MSKKLPPRRSNALQVHVHDLNRSTVGRYVQIQRVRGQLESIGRVDVDFEQVVARPFLCDRHRCIQWTPHERKADARPLIDNSCCSRYSVPVTDMDLHKLAEVLPKVRKRLAPDHPLNVDPKHPPYELDENFAFVMQEQHNGACQFVLYDGGLTSCAIHRTCLEEGLDVWEYKPIGCSLWPLALIDYEEDGQERLLLTVYARATARMFEDSDDSDHNDEAHFACLVDKDPKYDPLYRTMEGVLRRMLGADFYTKLDQKAKKYRRRA